ncbi:hypothetical protein EOI86_10840 [Hwanghaeella grinnelliae]|uniref:ATP-grasp domain-containing protein n=1 Tax=Hwanghaeella grinnelliae TaxID=2500179 RepID=A0A437QMX9_9PROT|nr:hypothetical protein [Hwanghaeella grinnelliae]RVU35759.1 hypothetical protein EOI86_10840 [Hwanghaeella grinnelliae]
MRKQPIARFVRPVKRILFLSDMMPEAYVGLTANDRPSSFEAHTASHLYRALTSTGVDVLATSRPEDILTYKGEVDFVFSARASYDYPSVDVPVASLCEVAGLPCLNGNTFAVAMARDKALSKLAAIRAGVPTPDWVTIQPGDALDRLTELSYPAVIKWTVGGNSFSIAGDGLVASAEEAVSVARKWQRSGLTVMAEDFVPGADLIVGVIDRGAKGLLIGKVVRVDTDHPENIQTYEHKMIGRGVRRRTVLTDKELYKRIHDLVHRLYDEIKPLDCFRVDFRWNQEEDSLHFLEVNPTANSEPESIFVQSLAREPKKHRAVMLAVLDAGLSRHALRLPRPEDASQAIPDREPVGGPKVNSPAAQVTHKPLRRLLFLAQFAPLGPETMAEFDQEWGSLSRYHHQLYRTLVELGLDVLPARHPEDLIRLRDKVDFVFSVYEGARFPSTEAVVPAMCEAAGLPFLGARAGALALVADKQLCKLLASRLGIPTPNWIRIGPRETGFALDTLNYPCIVKWQLGANSEYIDGDSIVADPAAASAKVSEFQARDLPVIVEEFVPGTNLTTAALASQGGFQVGQTIRTDTDAPGNIQTYEQKMFDKGRRSKSRFDDASGNARIQTYMAKLHEELRPVDYFRADFRYNEATGEIFFLEANIQCNLDPLGTFCLSTVGGPDRYPDLVRDILAGSLMRQGLRLPETTLRAVPSLA